MKIKTFFARFKKAETNMDFLLLTLEVEQATADELVELIDAVTASRRSMELKGDVLHFIAKHMRKAAV